MKIKSRVILDLLSGGSVPSKTVLQNQRSQMPTWREVDRQLLRTGFRALEISTRLKSLPPDGGDSEEREHLVRELKGLALAIKMLWKLRKQFRPKPIPPATKMVQ